jgi:phosphate transport system substrate-binding protein
MFSKSNNPGQIVYLSSGFVNQNLDLIKSKGYGIMAYGDDATSYDVNSIDTPDGYNWFRPLNVMTSVTGDDTYTTEMQFIKTLLSDEYKDKLASIGAKALNDDEIS